MNLYPHQIEGLQKAQNLNRVAYFWDMGLGKTFAGSEKMMQLGAKVNLVVCQKSKVQDWIDHFDDNYSLNVLNYNLTRQNDFEVFLRETKELDFDEIAIGIINYDLLWRRKELLSLSDFTLILDESSLIQNDSAKRTKFILKMHPANVILLSGTPTGGKYQNLWTQIHLLGWNISKDLYMNQFVETELLELGDGRKVPVVTGYKNIERLKRKMRQHGCQFLKTDEVFDLPDQVFQMVKVESSKAYRAFRKDKIITIGEETLVGDTTLTRMLYERMLCGAYSEEKQKAFVDILDSTSDRLVVFYNFNKELEVLKALCGDRPISEINGQTKDLTAYETADDAITLVNYQAGAMGLNLQKSCRMVFYSLPLSSELFEQAKKRIHRIGQQNTCFYYTLICCGSIEERIKKVLEERKDYTEKLFEQEE